MNEEQFEAFKQWLGAFVAEKIEDAFGRDSTFEAIKRSALEQELRKKLGIKS